MKKIIYLITFFLIFTANAWATPRYISLTPATTEILFALGLDEEIIGVSSFCNYPDAAQAKEKVGTFSQANIEKIINLKPDMIFCTGLEQAPIVTKLKQLGLKIYICDPVNFQELLTSISDIGRLTSKEDNARIMVENMEASVNDIKEKNRSIPADKRQKVFIEIWGDPLMTAGRGSFIDELISIAGGVNIAHDMPKPYGYFSPEQVLKHNPQVIILGYMAEQQPAEILKTRLGWQNIAAIKDDRVYNDINPDTIFRPGPRVIESLKEIRKRLYPQP